MSCVQIDEDPLVCTLLDSLVLQTINEEHTFSISEGCERKLVTTCDEQILDLEIRVDFFQNNFTSTKVSIFYEGETVIIDDNFTLDPATPPNSEILYESDTSMASVSIPQIMLVVTRNLTVLTISSDNISLPLAGLCGCTDGKLYFPDCNSTVDIGQGLDSFKQSYKVKPSDQILRGERKECGKYR